ncbi:MAG: LacI family DNA-binding transcriptional regulator [Aestuariivirga sp.]
MVKRPTLTDLAHAAGVSIATVDRVINRRLPVSDDTAQRVVKAAEHIGYHATSLLKRRIAETPVRKFGFLLQKRDAFYQNLGRELVQATKSAKDIEGKAVLEFIEELVPAVVAKRLRDIAPKVDALAVVAMDHPQINQAVDEIVARGKPVFTLLSQITTPSCKGHVGLDSRKCGRIAGWAISRMAKQEGRIGILVGSHRYLNQETSEISFRAYMREHAPRMQLLEPIINLDDERIAYEAVSDMLASYPDLAAIYVAGGGQDGLIKALRELTGQPRPVAVCNELTANTKAALIDNVIDLALGTPVLPLALRTISHLTAACEEGRFTPQQTFLPPEIFVSENV